MKTYAIGYGPDPLDLTVEETPDGYGAFPTEAIAARRLLQIVEGRRAVLEKSARKAREILKKASKAGGSQ